MQKNWEKILTKRVRRTKKVHLLLDLSKKLSFFLLHFCHSGNAAGLDLYIQSRSSFLCTEHNQLFFSFVLHVYEKERKKNLSQTCFMRPDRVLLKRDWIRQEHNQRKKGLWEPTRIILTEAKERRETQYCFLEHFSFSFPIGCAYVI